MHALPLELWKEILKHTTFKERLSYCSLVCKAFQKAATAATDSLQVGLRQDPYRTEAVTNWIDKHGSGLSSLA